VSFGANVVFAAPGARRPSDPSSEPSSIDVTRAGAGAAQEPGPPERYGRRLHRRLGFAAARRQREYENQ
jgi:hypothetical protein